MRIVNVSSNECGANARLPGGFGTKILPNLPSTTVLGTIDTQLPRESHAGYSNSFSAKAEKNNKDILFRQDGRFLGS